MIDRDVCNFAKDSIAIIVKIHSTLFSLQITEKAAKTLGCQEDFMKRLIEWCAVEDHAGVKGNKKAFQ